MPAEKNFTFICGADDFLVGRLGQARFNTLAAGVTDEFSREVLSGFAGNVGEVEDAINRFRERVQTVSMFGGPRVIWLKDVNFLADTVTGRAESTLKLVEDLQQLLEAVNPADTTVLVTAAPIDRRRSFPKWCEECDKFQVHVLQYDDRIDVRQLFIVVGHHSATDDMHGMDVLCVLSDDFVHYRSNLIGNGWGKSSEICFLHNDISIA